VRHAESIDRRHKVSSSPVPLERTHSLQVRPGYLCSKFNCDTSWGRTQNKREHTLKLTIPTSTQNKQPSVEFGTCWIHSGGGGSGLVTGITWWLRVRSWQLIYCWERRVDVFPFYGLMEKKRIVWLPAGWVERVETNDDEVWLATTTSCIRALFRTVKISATHAAARFF